MPSGGKIILNPEYFTQLYKESGSVEHVAKKLGLSFDGVREWMKRNNMPLVYKKKYTANENFFSEENEQSFYWAGFIAADGCVLEKGKRYAHILKICLSIKDLEHLKLFRENIKSNNRIFYGENKSPKSNNITEHCYISICSRKICEDLENFNIVPRKTLIFKMPSWLVEHKLAHHFLRGYIDGDGCFSSVLRKGKKTKQIINKKAIMQT